jgi:hypothetical protein
MKQPQRGKVANPTGPPQVAEVLTRTRLLAAYEGLVVLSRLMSPPTATGGVVSYELYDAPGCVCDRVEDAKALVTGALAQPGDPGPGTLREAYNELVNARAGLAVAPAALSWGEPGAAAEAAGRAWLREIERVLEATLARLREFVASVREGGPVKKPRGR